MTEKKEMYTVTSISIPVRVRQWLDDNVDNRSRLISELIDDYIDSVSGYDERIKSLREAQEKILDELDRVNDEIAALEEAERERIEREDEERRRRLLRIGDL